MYLCYRDSVIYNSDKTFVLENNAVDFSTHMAINDVKFPLMVAMIQSVGRKISYKKGSLSW
jgi:hypothetical protein